MDRAKLAELRRKKLEKKASEEKARHSELLTVQNDVALAVKSLHETLNNQEIYDDSKLINQVEELKKSLTFTKQIDKIEKAIKEIPNEVEVSDFPKLIKSVDTLKLGNNNIVKSIKALIDTIEEQTPSQLPENYMPTRRVRRIGARLVFDDDPLQVNVTGGGGGGGSGIPASAFTGDRLKVSNGAIVPCEYDYIGMTYPDDTTDVATYKVGGASGETVAVVTTTYVDSSKELISSIARV